MACQFIQASNLLNDVSLLVSVCVTLPVSVLVTLPAALQVPADAAIAVRLMAQQQSEAAEREQIKALVLEANLRDEAEQQAAATLAAQRAAAATGRRPYRGGRGHHGGGLYKYQTPAGAARQQGPQLTLRQHVSQLTGPNETE
jgi:hypothetical protein